ncbi:MAG TPA: TonB-dependent receptor [Gemmatimonadales bacterium]|nr:TonB-dependent receptor [Gemmatimonadales bacterium]
MALLRHVGLLFSFTLLVPLSTRAQARGGAIAGHVTDAAAKAIPGATIRILGTHWSARARDDGSFRIENVPAGSYRLATTLIGFLPDTANVAVTDGATSEVGVRLAPAAVDLPAVLVTAHRLGETKAVALDRQQVADNLVTVLAGDEIRALPNGNAAEAAGRMPDVSLERDEGEGKFVQIRGTAPRLSNVTVDGVHIPGTEQGDRIVKLDDVPSDILAAIEVSKTLTADMDADAIGGSLNLVTKVPEGRPQGYVAAQYGRMSLLSRDVTQGSLTYGGRVGPDEKLGYLIGGSLDRNNRGINDLEPSWTVDGSNRSVPIEWSQRDYTYYRTRIGVGADVDYRFNDHSSVYLRGLWSLFKNHGTRYVYDISASPAGTIGFDTSAVFTREVQQRTPVEQLWGLTGGGRQERGDWTLDYSAHYAGTRQSEVDYRTSDFVYTPSGSASLIQYNAANSQMPVYQYASAAQAQAAVTPTNFLLSGYDASNGLTTGRDLGGEFNATRAYLLGAHLSTFKFGVRVRDEHKDYTRGNVTFSANQAYALTNVVSGFSDPSYYSDLASGFSMGPVPDLGATQQYENANPGAFTNQTDTVRNQLASFTGAERVIAGYILNTVELGRLRVNVGVRVEVTHSAYTGNVAASDSATGTTTVSGLSGTQHYTDVFPSAQLRYGVDPNTNVRIAVTRGIARPNYSDLAPSLQGNINAIYQHQYSNLSAGNPNLRPERAWSYDLLIERFLPSLGGVISGGVFYKALSDVILTQNFIYQGPYTPFDGFYGTTPQNGGSGHLVGVEADWVQHLSFLPGAWAGLGLDVNWTHVSSKVLVDPATGRQAPLLRQAPDIGNAALLYDHGPVSARIAWTYNGPYIGGYGDGTATASGDNYFEKHSQIDASVIFNMTPSVQMQLQALSLNNAEFGFFQGTPDHQFNVQREYYGRTFYLGMKYGF